jgi:hypothetical protein
MQDPVEDHVEMLWEYNFVICNLKFNYLLHLENEALEDLHDAETSVKIWLLGDMAGPLLKTMWKCFRNIIL